MVWEKSPQKIISFQNFWINCDIEWYEVMMAKINKNKSIDL